ncbi:hypothetical protein BU14_2327s0001 [Porphyra umbilicalis]|uniref:Uncharacterized protein n=1 Tax=Porphyra umbilicalis TaxID=2786 RepID=A0A1X6NJD7_PORUM|nr:hypothetical protein BU14_2327s0001 [Porphyra umbilicalis]|eukprot:OSX68729.1 hypothetical protein BU14_2327s0001 [Porphyra umbilicalis]
MTATPRRCSRAPPPWRSPPRCCLRGPSCRPGRPPRARRARRSSAPSSSPPAPCLSRAAKRSPTAPNSSAPRGCGSSPNSSTASPPFRRRLPWGWCGRSSAWTTSGPSLRGCRRRPWRRRASAKCTGGCWPPRMAAGRWLSRCSGRACAPRRASTCTSWAASPPGRAPAGGCGRIWRRSSTSLGRASLRSSTM